MQPKARQLYDRLLAEKRVGGYGWGSFGQRVYGFCSSQVIAQTPLLSEQATLAMLQSLVAPANEQPSEAILPAPVFTTDKPKLLDLFCGGGGAGMGYHLAGFEVVGVDLAFQKRYPFQFIQADALAYAERWGHLFDVIHASPPCQFASQMFNPKKPELKAAKVNLIPDTRRVLQTLGKPYVIENVMGAIKHLQAPLTLHGSQFGLPIFRERAFEICPTIFALLPPKREDYDPVPINGSSKAGRHHAPAEVMGQAMGIDWMTKAELRQAIPPAYTEWIGKQLMAHLARTNVTPLPRVASNEQVGKAA